MSFVYLSPPPELSDSSDSDFTTCSQSQGSPATPVDPTPPPVSIVDSDESIELASADILQAPVIPSTNVTSPAPAYPVYLWAVKISSYPGIFDNYNVALNHAATSKDIHKFESRGDAEEFMKDCAYKTYHTSENSDVSHTGERIYKVYTDGSHTAAKKRMREDGSWEVEGAFSGYGVWFGENHPDNVAAKYLGPLQCSQQAELQALVEAYRIIADRYDHRTYEIYCDCPSAIEQVNLSCLNYCRFRPAVEKIRKYRKRSNATIYLRRVMGHNGDVGNEHAHYLANMGRKGNYGQNYPCVNGDLRHTMRKGTYGLRAMYIYSDN